MPKTKKYFDFIGNRKIFLIIAGAFLLTGLIFNIIFGTQFDIEFKGGTLLAYSYTGEINADDVKKTVDDVVEQDCEVTLTSDISGETKQFTVSYTGELENKYVYSFTGDISEENIKTVVNDVLGDDVTITKNDSQFTVVPSGKVTGENISALTTRINSSFSSNGVKLVYSGSTTDMMGLIHDAIIEKYGTRLVYNVADGFDTTGLSTTIADKTDIDVAVTLDGTVLKIVPSNTAVAFGDKIADITAAVQEKESTAALSESVENGIETLRENSVNGLIGKGFFIKCIFAIILGAVFVTVYVGIRFRKIGGVSAAVFAMLALLHDVLIAYFVYVVFRIPLDENFIAVVLTLLGYSLNDTIVIYDRIRENERLFGNTKSVSEIVNDSVNQCLTRNINTSLATFAAIAVICVVALMNGITSIMSFAFPMAVGIVAGCYSSVVLSSPLWAAWREHKLKKQKAKSAK